MDHYAGIDVSLATSTVCILDATGRVVREAKVASEPEALAAFLAGCGHHLARIGLEAGPLSQWLHAGLVQAGLPAVLVETRQVRAALSAMRAKTDRNDARGIAQLIRMGWFRPVHAEALPAQEVGLLRGFGLKMGPVGAAGFERRVRELMAGQATLERVMEPMLRARQALRVEYATLHRDLLRIVRMDDVCGRLMTVPGVGEA